MAVILFKYIQDNCSQLAFGSCGEASSQVETGGRPAASHRGTSGLATCPFLTYSRSLSLVLRYDITNAA